MMNDTIDQMDDLLIRQKTLQQEAEKQITELELRSLLSPFGEVTVVGSVVTGLMTWPDVDIEVIVPEMPSKEAIGELGKTLYSHPDIVRVWLMDNRTKIDAHQPRGLYVGVKRLVGETIWKFDMWFLKADDQRSGKDDIQWVKETLTPETKAIILSIKDQISDNPKYRKAIFSIDIYKAVLEEGVQDLEGFKQYLAKTGRTL